MGYLNLILLLVVFSALAVVVDRRIQERKRRNKMAVDENNTRFKDWARDAFADSPRVAQWLGSLPNEAIQALAGRLEEFCHDLGFQSQWVLNNDAARLLTPTLRPIAVQYVKSCYDAYHCQDDIQSLESWLVYQQNPTGQPAQEFGRQLLTHLISAGVVAQTERALLTAEGESASKIYAVLCSAVERNPVAFRMALKTVLAGPTETTARAPTKTQNGHVSPTKVKA